MALMGRSRVLSREEWVAKWRASGLAGTDFSVQHGLKRWALYDWARKLERKRASAEVRAADKRLPVEFTAVEITGAARQEQAKDGGVEVVARSGHVVRVRDVADLELLRAVLQLVEQC